VIEVSVTFLFMIKINSASLFLVSFSVIPCHSSVAQPRTLGNSGLSFVMNVYYEW
jgi:hypothetical protein